MKLRRKLSYTGFAFVLPAVLHLVVFFVVPFALAIYMSLTRWPLTASWGQASFIGLRNYADAVTSSAVQQAIVNTLLFAVGVVVGGTVIGLIEASVIHSTLRPQWWWRFLFFLPYVTSVVASSIVWKSIYDPVTGLLNAVLGPLGLPALAWLQEPSTALWALVAMQVWRVSGYACLILGAGLSQIPKDLFDAGKVDGASTWALFRHVTIPLLMPVIAFVVVILSIGALQIFTEVFMMTGGGPVDATNVVVLEIYRRAFQFMQLGRAAAIAVLFFVVVAIVSGIELKLMIGRR